MQSEHTKIKIILVLSDNTIVRASFVIPFSCIILTLRLPPSLSTYIKNLSFGL